MLKSVALSAVFLVGSLSAAIADRGDIYEGATEEAFNAFMAGIDREFPDAEEQKLAGEGFLALVLKRYPPARNAEGLAAMALLPDAIEAAPTTFQGVSYEDLYQAGVAASDRSKVRQAENEARERLENKVAICLAERMPVSETSYKIKRSDWSSELLLDLHYSVTNDLDRAVQEVIVDLEVRSPKREVPWLEARLAKDVPGGIEPGETKALTFLLGGSKNAFLGEEDRKYEIHFKTVDVSDASGTKFAASYQQDGFGAEFCAKQDVMELIGSSN